MSLLSLCVDEGFTQSHKNGPALRLADSDLAVPVLRKHYSASLSIVAVYSDMSALGDGPLSRLQIRCLHVIATDGGMAKYQQMHV
jgi:hypothetical protein